MLLKTVISLCGCSMSAQTYVWLGPHLIFVASKPLFSAYVEMTSSIRALRKTSNLVVFHS